MIIIIIIIRIKKLYFKIMMVMMMMKHYYRKLTLEKPLQNRERSMLLNFGPNKVVISRKR